MLVCIALSQLFPTANHSLKVWILSHHEPNTEILALVFFDLYRLLSTSPQNLPESPLKLYGVLEETAYLDPLERLSDYFLNARRV